jgi:putative ABC transport system permease protein
MDVYVPLPTMLLRYRDRAQVTQAEMEAANKETFVVAGNDSTESDDQRAERRNYHQLDKIIVQVDKSTAGARGRGGRASHAPTAP